MKRRTLSVLALLSAGLGAGAVLAVTRDAPGTSATPAPSRRRPSRPASARWGGWSPRRASKAPTAASPSRAWGRLFVGEGDGVAAGSSFELGDVAQKDASLAQAEASLEEPSESRQTVAGGRPSDSRRQRARIRSSARRG
jgi:hypothetical protein